MKEYLETFVFGEQTDARGNKFKKAYSNIVIPCVISINGKNTLVNGRLNLFERKGESKFGDEIGIAFNIEEIKEEYPSNSKHQTIEFYLGSDEGMRFLQMALNHFKGVTN